MAIHNQYWCDSTIKEKVLPLLNSVNSVKCLNDLWDLIGDNRLWHASLAKLFYGGVKRKVFWITPIGLYMLCLATGKTGKAKLLRSEMEQREVSISLLDRIDGMYKERKHETDR